ncbi:hypothetical protein L207DRAFT_519090 [Hyaloscypha variabilis F]|uniref:Uncharacterized protein n=1 Tax=Hyaloscypha variabilis (strain UAMH 11265 / GT02V1 / F) TaxID=1149755 RepID=A0A2J6QZT2_HYAVF|nr:hypothetical protein L207DRAFT_519090 [Hyaloscypha variabilis F]
MKFSLLALPALLPCTLAYIGELCGNTNDGIGTCELNSWCNANSGRHNIANLCPNDPDDVMCCFYPLCDGGTGYCMDASLPNAGFDCHHDGGVLRQGYCPGPDNYECCAALGD